MMESIVVTCPGFGPEYDAFLVEWSDETDIPYYVVLGDFSRYLIKLLEDGEREELSAAFGTIEQLHLDGDDYVREAATIGILESLQNSNLNERTEPDQFLEYLRPVSLKYWQKVTEFWDEGKIITDD